MPKRYYVALFFLSVVCGLLLGHVNRMTERRNDRIHYIQG